MNKGTLPKFTAETAIDKTNEDYHGFDRFVLNSEPQISQQQSASHISCYIIGECKCKCLGLSTQALCVRTIYNVCTNKQLYKLCTPPEGFHCPVREI